MIDLTQKYYFVYNITFQRYHDKAYTKIGPAKALCTASHRHYGDDYQVVTCMLIPIGNTKWPK